MTSAGRVCALILGLLAAVLANALLRPFDRSATDLLKRLRAGRTLDSRIFLVDLERWPVPRAELASAIDAISAASARVIVLDVLLDSPGDDPGRGAHQTEMLATAVRRSGRVVLPLQTNGDATGFIEPLSMFITSRDLLGFASFLTDSDGVVRRCRLLWRGQASLALAAISKMEGRRLDEMTAGREGAARLDGTEIPGEGGALVVDFAAGFPPGEQLIGFGELLTLGARQPEALSTLLRDKLVIVGRLTTGGKSAGSEDLFLVPGGPASPRPMTGALIHANIASSLLQKEFLRPAGRVVSALLLLGWFGFGSFALSRLGPAAALAVLAAGAVFHAGIAAAACSRLGWLLPTGVVPAGVLGAGVFALLGRRRLSLPERPAPRQWPDSIAVLRIESEPAGDKVRYGFHVSLQGGSRGPHGLPGSAYHAFASHRDELVAAFRTFTYVDLKQPAAEVERLGQQLFERLLGPDFGRLVESLEAGFLALELEERELELPWELARFGDRFLCERMAIGRCLLASDLGSAGVATALPARAEDRPIRVLCVANPRIEGKPDLPAAEEEAAVLSEMFGELGRRVAFRKLVREEATLERFLEELAPGVDILHFSGHSTYSPTDPRKTGLLFGAGVFDPKNLESALLGRPPALIYLNSCESARSLQRDLWGLASRLHLPRAFIQAGVSMFVGSLWRVEDAVAREMALDFYGHLMQGAPVGTSLKLSRQARRNAWMTHLAYVLYGDPRTRLTRQGWSLDAAPPQTGDPPSSL